MSCAVSAMFDNGCRPRRSNAWPPTTSVTNAAMNAITPTVISWEIVLSRSFIGAALTSDLLVVD